MRRRSLTLLGVAAAVAIAAAGLAAMAALQYNDHRVVRTAPPVATVPDSFDCRPPKQHPNPVVLVHGTFAATSWQALTPALTQRGYCVFTFNYGDAGTGDIVASAHELSRFVNHVLARTGAKRVSIVGHSEGGMMPRYYVKFLGGSRKVEDLVGLSPSNHGTENPLGYVGAAFGCAACGQQVSFGSTFLAKLNRGNETPAPVDYTVIQTRNDAVVIPYSSAFLDGPGSRITNITLQNSCPYDDVDHLNTPVDPVAVQWVLNALSRGGPADPAFKPRCE